MKRMGVHLLGLAFTLFFIASFGSAALGESVGLAWKPSPSVGATGYNVYYGVSGSFTNKQDAGNVTSTTIYDLQPGNSYFFFATTYDGTGDESGPSEVVFYTVNSAPIALNLTGETLRDQPLAITLAGSDSDADPLEYVVVDLPLHGTLNGVAPALVYTPSPGYAGPDAFAYKVNDGKVDSAMATVELVVVEPPDSNPPSVAVLTPSNGSTVSGVVAINVGAADNVGISRVDLYLNGNFAGTLASSPAAFTWDTRSQADGTWTIHAKAYDPAGNLGVSASVSVTVQNIVPDTTAPAVNILSPKGGSKISGATEIQVAAQDDGILAKVECFVNGALLGVSSSASPTFAWDTKTYPDGSHIIQAQAFDAEGNSAEVSTSVLVENASTQPDTTLPVVVITSLQEGATVSGTIMIDVQATDDRGVTAVELFVDATSVTSAAVGMASLPLDTSGLANGSHIVEIRAYDDAGNIGSVSLTVNVQNATGSTDTTPPTVSISSPRDGTTVKKNFSVKIMSSDEVGVTLVELYLDGELCATSTTRNPSFTVVTSTLPSSYHTFQAKAYDASGNVGISGAVTIRK